MNIVITNHGSNENQQFDRYLDQVMGYPPAKIEGNKYTFTTHQHRVGGELKRGLVDMHVVHLEQVLGGRATVETVETESPVMPPDSTREAIPMANAEEAAAWAGSDEP